MPVSKKRLILSQWPRRGRARRAAWAASSCRPSRSRAPCRTRGRGRSVPALLPVERTRHCLRRWGRSVRVVLEKTSVTCAGRVAGNALLADRLDRAFPDRAVEAASRSAARSPRQGAGRARRPRPLRVGGSRPCVNFGTEKSQTRKTFVATLDDMPALLALSTPGARGRGGAGDRPRARRASCSPAARRIAARRFRCRAPRRQRRRRSSSSTSPARFAGRACTGCRRARGSRMP